MNFINRNERNCEPRDLEHMRAIVRMHKRNEELAERGREVMRRRIVSLREQLELNKKLRAIQDEHICALKELVQIYRNKESERERQMDQQLLLQHA